MTDNGRSAQADTIARQILSNPDLYRDVMERINNPDLLPPQQEKSRLVIHPASYALENRTKPQYLWEGRIRTKTIGAFYGDGGEGKTSVLLDLLVHSAAKIPEWLGEEIRSSNVLYLDSDMGEYGIGERLSEVLRGENISGDIDFHFAYSDFQLDDDDDVTILSEIILDGGFDVVVFDALANIMTGDENNKQDVQPVFSNIRKISERTGATVIVVHHSNKIGGFRGSTVIKNGVDWLLKMEKKNNVLQFEFEKNRFDPLSKWQAVATWAKNDEGQTTYTLRATTAESVEHLSDSQGYVLRFLRESLLPKSVQEIEDHADACSPDAARRALYTLVNRGKVRRTNPGGRGITALYQMTEVADVPL